jgi:hypothetical protein
MQKNSREYERGTILLIAVAVLIAASSCAQEVEFEGSSSHLMIEGPQSYPLVFHLDGALFVLGDTTFKLQVIVEGEGEGEGEPAPEVEGEPYEENSVYVSNDGNDANDGQQASPVKTLEAACSMLRSGYALYLERGGAWREQINTRAYSSITVDAYGDGERPRIDNAGKGFYLNNYKHKPIADITLKNIHFYGSSINVLGELYGLTIDSCYFEQCGISVQSTYGLTSHVSIKDSVIVDSYSTDSHAQGLFVNAVEGLVVDNCLFDHNGWNEDIEGAGRQPQYLCD